VAELADALDLGSSGVTHEGSSPSFRIMKSELIDVSETKKNLDIEIPQEVVDHEIQHIAQEFARKARVPGFRPGKAPVAVVRTRYREEIVSEMMQHLLPKYFSDAIQERKLYVIDNTPSFEKVDYSNGQPLKFKAAFQVYPELNITNYVGVPVEQVATHVDESEVDNALKQLQEENAEMVPVDEERPIKEGDFAEISFKGVIHDSEAPPVTGDKVMCEIGARTTLKEFSENLTGARAGDHRTFDVSYREDYPEKRLAGKTVTYTLIVDSLKEKKLPEINDELAQGYGDYKTLDELKNKIRADLEKHKSTHAGEQMREKILEWLEDNNNFEAPEALVERQLETRLHRMLRDLTRQGINPQRLDVDWSKIREDQRAQSLRDVKGSLILEYVAEKETIQVTDEEIDAEIDSIAQETQKPREKVREVLGREAGLNRLKGQVRNRKTLDFLQEKAEIKPAS
jgi:trigger factor